MTQDGYLSMDPFAGLDDAERPRPIDPRTGQAVLVPGDIGYRVPGSEPEPEGPGALSLASSALGGALSTINPVNIARGLYAAATDLPGTVSSVLGSMGDQRRQGVDLIKRGGALNTVEGAGRLLASAIPILGPAAARVGDEIGSGDPTRMARGVGEGVMLAAGGPLARKAGQVMAPRLRSAAERVAGTALRPGDDILSQIPGAASPAAARQALARTALDEGVLPGIVRTGASRADAVMNNLLDSSGRQLAGAAGDAPISTMRAVGPEVTRAQRTLATQFAPKQATTAANNAVRQIHSHPLLVKENARELGNIAAGNVRQVRGATGAAADATRALGRDARAEIARVAPGTASTMGRISRLEPVAESLRRSPMTPLEVPGLPTIQARILLSGVNRLIGPAARGADAAAKGAGVLAAPGGSRLMQQAILAQLLGQPEGVR